MGGFGSKRFFLFLLIGSVAVSALVGIGVLLFGNFGLIEVRILMTTLTVTITSILGLACGAYLESGRAKYLPWAGIVFSVIAALMSFFIIWDVLDDDDVFIKSFLTATILAAAFSHFSLISLARLDSRFAWTRTAAALCIAPLCAILLYIIWFEPEGDSDIVYRVLGVLAILVASITVITPVLHRLSSTETDVGAIDREIEKLRARIAELEERKSAASQEAAVE